jgi:hypothetical protein
MLSLPPITRVSASGFTHVSDNPSGDFKAHTIPGAGYTQELSANNRTLWPLAGGAVVWNSSHPDALTYINLGLGNAVTSFNISLQGVYNETGAGVTCLPNPGAATIRNLSITEGQNASIQVITISSSGAALYSVSIFNP